VDETVYRVLLEGRTVGPYDRRTIVGMRIKKTLTSDHVLISTEGAQLTVADLIGPRPAQPFNPERSGSISIVQATFPASLLAVHGRGMAIPRFKDEVQARIQGDVLRLAGHFRQGLRWKEDRVKIVLKDVVHARVRGSQIELWLRNAPESPLQRVALELFTAESAGEFADWLPVATPFPEGAAATPAAAAAPSSVMSHAGLWMAALGLTVVMALMLTVLVLRRV
jgi:hypothetical protein